MHTVVALILFFAGGDLKGAQVVGLAKDVQTCQTVLTDLMAQHKDDLPEGVKAVPACLNAAPDQMHPTGKQQATEL
jgi:hypothetical protein